MPINGFVTFAGFTCQYRVALSPRMFIFQRLSALIAEPNWLEKGLYFANVTMPRKCRKRRVCGPVDIDEIDGLHDESVDAAG